MNSFFYSKIKYSLALLGLLLFLIAVPYSVSAAAVEPVLSCGADGVSPTVTVTWGDWGDYDHGRPIEFALYRTNNFSPSNMLASFSFSGKDAFYTETYTDTNVTNGTSYTYYSRRKNGDGTYDTRQASINIKCGVLVNVDTNISTTGWSLDGGSYDTGGLGDGGVYVPSGTYTISFSPPSGYVMNYMEIEGVEGGSTGYLRVYGDYTFTTTSFKPYGSDTFITRDVNIRAYFTKSEKPQLTLLCPWSTNGDAGAIVAWSDVEGATEYRVWRNGTTFLGYTNDPSVSTKVTLKHGQTYSINTTAHDSGGSIIYTSPSADITADCSYSLNINTNFDGGIWKIGTKLRPSLINPFDSSGAFYTSSGGSVVQPSNPGSGTSGSYTLLGSNGLSGITVTSYVHFVPYIGVSLGSINGSSYGSSIGVGQRPGQTYTYNVEWHRSVTPQPSSTYSCVNDSPSATISWGHRLSENLNQATWKLIRTNQNNNTATIVSGRLNPEFQGCSGTCQPNTWVAYSEQDGGLNNVADTYTYSLHYEADGYTSEVTTTTLSVGACESTPVDAQISIQTNLPSATWSMRQDGASVLSGQTGNYSNNFTISGSSDTFVLTPSTVEGYTFTVSNNKDSGGATMSGVSAGDSYSYTVTYSENPTVSISADPTEIESGDNTLLTWETSRVQNCVASGGWSGSKATSGSSWIMNIYSNTDFTLTCESISDGSLVASSVTVTVTTPQCRDGIDNDSDGLVDTDDPDCVSLETAIESGTLGPAPTVSLSASPNRVIPGETTTLLWNNTNVSECRAFSGPWSGVWTGSQALSGSSESNAINNSPTEFTIECDSVQGSVTVDASTTITFVDPYFQLQKVGTLKIEAYSGTSTPAVIKVAPISGYDEDITLQAGVNPSLPGSVNTFSKGTLSSSEYDSGSLFRVFVPSATRSGTYPITIRAEGGDGYITTMNVDLIIRNPGNRAIEEF